MKPQAMALIVGLPVMVLLASVSGMVYLKSSAAGSAESLPLPSLGTVPEFSLTSQTGETVTPKTLRGRPFLAAFMFTRCPSICPKVTARMVSIHTEATQRQLPLTLVSFSVDGDNDTPQVLSAYAKKNKATGSAFVFLTGDSAAIAKTAEEGFKVGVSGTVEEGKEHLGITHGSHLVLVDASGTIRGFYRSFDDAEQARLLSDLARLRS